MGKLSVGLMGGKKTRESGTSLAAQAEDRRL